VIEKTRKATYLENILDFPQFNNRRTSIERRRSTRVMSCAASLLPAARARHCLRSFGGVPPVTTSCALQKMEIHTAGAIVLHNCGTPPPPLWSFNGVHSGRRLLTGSVHPSSRSRPSASVGPAGCKCSWPEGRRVVKIDFDKLTFSYNS